MIDPIVVGANDSTALVIARADVKNLQVDLGPVTLLYDRETGTLGDYEQPLQVHLKFLYNVQPVDPPMPLAEWEAV